MTVSAPEAVAAPVRADRVPAPRRRHPLRFAVLVGLGVLLLLIVAPLLVVALNAVKSPAEYAGRGPLSVPTSLYLHGTVDFWNRVDFSRKLLNSFVVSLAV